MLDISPDIAWFVLPVVIFLARTFDMTLSTLRIIFIAQGHTVLAPLIGFFEALVWLLVIGQALQHLSNPWCALAYAAGFAAGNYAGLRLEERLAMGKRILRVIVQSPETAEREAGVRQTAALVDALRGEGFGVTAINGDGLKGPVKILFTLLRRRDVPRALEIVKQCHENAFVSVGDVRQVGPAIYPNRAAASTSWLPWHVLGKAR